MIFVFLLYFLLLDFLDCTMAQAVSRRPSTAEAWVRARVSPFGFCGGQSGIETGFSPSSSVSPVSIIPLELHIYVYIYIYIYIYIYVYIIIWGKKIGPLVAAVQRHSFIHRNNINKIGFLTILRLIVNLKLINY
jgi:hypothetical protein